jgi:hypothetical protein
LFDRPHGDHALALAIERSQRGSRTLGREQEHVEISPRLDQAEAHRQAVAEAQRRAMPEMRFDLPVKRAVDLVGGEHHHDVGGFDRFLDQIDSKGRRLGLDGASRSSAQADDDIDPAVVEVQRLGAALIAIADNRHSLACERCGIHVGVAQHVHDRAD